MNKWVSSGIFNCEVQEDDNYSICALRQGMSWNVTSGHSILKQYIEFICIFLKILCYFAFYVFIYLIYYFYYLYLMLCLCTVVKCFIWIFLVITKILWGRYSHSSHFLDMNTEAERTLSNLLMTTLEIGGKAPNQNWLL